MSDATESAAKPRPPWPFPVGNQPAQPDPGKSAEACLPGVRNILSVDLGLRRDPTAVAWLEWTVPAWKPMTPPPGRPTYLVRSLRRFALGTPYSRVVDALIGYFDKPRLAGGLLCVDGTGVGIAVVQTIAEEMARAKTKACGMIAITITAGREKKLAGPGHWHVAKTLLASNLQALLGSRRLRMSGKIPDAAQLIQELESFKIKTTESGQDTFEAWRERDKDDLVLAVAMGGFVAETVSWPEELPASLPMRA